MNKWSTQLILLCLVIVGNLWLWQQNQLMQLVVREINISTGEASRPPPSITALAVNIGFSHGIKLVYQDSERKFLRSESDIQITSFNRWITELSQYNIAPEELEIKPANSNGNIKINSIRFIQD